MIEFNSPQLMKEKYQFELMDEAKHYEFLLECLGTEERARKALKGWNLDGTILPSTYKNISCVVSRVSDGALLCFIERAIFQISSKDDTYGLLQGGRLLHPDVRDRGVLTKDIAYENCYYFFITNPVNIIEFSVLMPPGISIEKRVPYGVVDILDYSKDKNGYKRFIISKEKWLADTNNGNIY